MDEQSKLSYERLALQEKLASQINHERFLQTQLIYTMREVKERNYVVYALEGATIFLSWYMAEPYAAGVLTAGAAMVGAFTWQLAGAIENKDFIQEQIASTQQQVSVLKTLLSACDDQQLRRSLQPR